MRTGGRIAIGLVALLVPTAVLGQGGPSARDKPSAQDKPNGADHTGNSAADAGSPPHEAAQPHQDNLSRKDDQAHPDTKAPPPAGTSAVVMDLSAIDGVIGRSVKSSLGEDMGRIVDLLVTPAGQVRAAVIDFGGVLGVGSRKVAVDWRTLSFGNLAKNGSIDLSLTRNEVRVAPEYRSGEPIVVLEPKATKTTPSEANNKASAGAAPQPSDAAKTSPTAPGR